VRYVEGGLSIASPDSDGEFDILRLERGLVEELPSVHVLCHLDRLGVESVDVPRRYLPVNRVFKLEIGTDIEPPSQGGWVLTIVFFQGTVAPAVVVQARPAVRSVQQRRRKVSDMLLEEQG